MKRSLRYVMCALAMWSAITVRARAESDVAVSATGVFGQSSSGNATTQTSAHQGGFLIEARHISGPLVGYEATYAFNRANQHYAADSAVCNGFACYTTTAEVPANQHEVTADWVVSLKILNFRPFVLAGGGVLVTSPRGGTVTTVGCGTINPLCLVSTSNAATQTQAKGEFTYGAGVDWTVLPHLGVRLQYRGREARAPDVATAFSSTGAFVRSSIPAVGVFLRF